MNSCIYSGEVWHRRLRPDHTFRKKLFMMYVDLAELPQLFSGRLCWSATFPTIAWLRRSDHLGDRKQPLDESVRQLVEKKSGFRPDGPIRLLTQFRYFGLITNPIALFYCFNRREELQFVVAEVTNVPWGEQHCYVLDVRASAGEMVLAATAQKQLHVSPFMNMNAEYLFQLNPPGQDLRIEIQNRFGSLESNVGFDACMKLKRTPIGSLSLALSLVRFPLMTAQIWFAIHWQAFRLWRKGARFHPHPQQHEETMDARGKITKAAG